MPRKIDLYLSDILDAIENIENYTSGLPLLPHRPELKKRDGIP